MHQSTEESVLKHSILVLILFASIGVFFGLTFQSQVILFEGLFNGLSIIISLLTLRVTRFIKQKDDDNFPFGKEAIIPLVILIQYLILCILLGSIVIEAINLIQAGGSQIDFGPVLIYLVITVLLQVLYVRKLKHIKTNSDIIKAELQQWKVSMIQSLFVLVGYGLGFIMMMTTLNPYVVYVEPVILLIFVLVTVKPILVEMVKAFKELIGMSTLSDNAYEGIEAKLDRIIERYSIKDYVLRVNRVGGVLVLEVDFLVDHAFECHTIKSQDMIREEIHKQFHDKYRDLWLSISFTADLRWIS